MQYYTSVMSFGNGQMEFLPISFKKRIIALKIEANYALILTDQGELYKLGNLPSENPSKSLYSLEDLPNKLLEFRSFRIKMITCSNTIIHALTEEGIVYSWGRDEDKNGLLGLGKVLNQSYPITPTAFINKKIKYINLGQKHAGAIDIKGKVYLWGTGSHGELGVDYIKKSDQPLEMMSNHEILNASSIYCDRYCTAVITVGGYLFFLGSLSRKDGYNVKPFQIKGLANIFIKSLIFIGKIAFVLSRNGELILIDKTFKTHKISFEGYDNDSIKDFSRTDETFLALTTSGLIYEWSLSDISHLKTSFDLINLPNLKQTFTLLDMNPESLILLPNSSNKYHIIGFNQNIEVLPNEKPGNPLDFSVIENPDNPSDYSIKPYNNSKITQMKEEIERVFSKKPINNPTKNIIKDLDQAFSSHRNSRFIEQLKYQRKIDLLSKELKRFNEIQPKNKEIQIFEDFKISKQEEIIIKPLNFSFMVQKAEEKPLDYFLTLINSNNPDKRAKTPDSSMKISFLSKRSFLEQNLTVSNHKNNQKSKIIVSNKKNKGLEQSFEKKSEEESCYSSIQTKKMSKRMYTFGLENETFEKKSQIIASTERNPSLVNLNENLVDIAKKLSGNIEELLVKLQKKSDIKENTPDILRNSIKKTEKKTFKVKSFVILDSKLKNMIIKRKFEVLFILKQNLIQFHYKYQKIAFSIKFTHNLLHKKLEKLLKASFEALYQNKGIPIKNNTFYKAQKLEASFNIFLLRFSFVNMRKTTGIIQNIDFLTNICIKLERKLNFNDFLNKLRDFCCEQVKNEHLKTLKSLAFNKILFLLFEIFQKRLKTAFQEVKKPVYPFIRHDKKTSLRDIMETMENLAKHQRHLGLETPNNKNIYYIPHKNEKSMQKFNKIQVECLCKAIEKAFFIRTKTIFKGIYESFKRKDKENLPRKLTKKEALDLENKQRTLNNNKERGYVQIMKEKSRVKQGQYHEIENIIMKNTFVLGNSNQEIEKDLNQSFGNISKIQLNNSNDSELSIFNLKKSNTLYKKSQLQVPNPKNKQLSQLKLLSSEFNDPKDPKDFILSQNLKEDPKEFGLADPHELDKSSSYLPRFQSPPELLFQDLNIDMISPKINEKHSLFRDNNSEIKKNYCSLVQYKSISPKKSNFESYLKENPNNERSLDVNNKENNKNGVGFINSHDKSRFNETETSKYSTGSVSNYKKVIDNQKRFIGNFNKQVYNKISGRVASPSYQEYLDNKKK